jgi:hypothetical protein
MSSSQGTAAPGVFTAAILTFVNAWDEFLLALTFMSRASMRTLSVGITLHQGEFAFFAAADFRGTDRCDRANLHFDCPLSETYSRWFDLGRAEGLIHCHA